MTTFDLSPEEKEASPRILLIGPERGVQLGEQLCRAAEWNAERFDLTDYDGIMCLPGFQDDALANALYLLALEKNVAIEVA